MIEHREEADVNVSVMADPTPIIVGIALQGIRTSKEGVKLFFPFQHRSYSNLSNRLSEYRLGIAKPSSRMKIGY